MTREISLTQGKVALISDEDYEKVSAYRWYANGYKRGRYWYAVHNEGQHPNLKATLLHRFILDAPKGMVVDHINGNGLDCRRENMRLCTNTENIRNQKPRRLGEYKGVQRRGRGWDALITVNYKVVSLGRFASEEAAARAYDAAAKKYHGEFARLNFPEP